MLRVSNVQRVSTDDNGDVMFGGTGNDTLRSDNDNERLNGNDDSDMDIQFSQVHIDFTVSDFDFI